MKRLGMFIFLCLISVGSYQAKQVIIIDETNYNQEISNTEIKDVTYQIESVPNDFKGVFSSCKNVTFENVTIIATETIKSSSSSVAGLCGYAVDSSFTNVENNVVITGVENVGGIVGYGENILMDTISNSGSISGYSNVGGIAGNLVNSNVFNVKNGINSNNHVQITGDNEIGGIVGTFKWNDSFKCAFEKCGISNVESMANVIAYNDNIGGLTGSAINSKTMTTMYIQGVYIRENQILSNGNNVGGLVGSVINESTNFISNILNNYNFNISEVSIDSLSNQYSNVSGGKNVGGLIGISDSTAYIENALVNKVEVDGIKNVGGLLGTNLATVNNATITNSVQIFGEDNYIGGVAGTNIGDISNVRISSSIFGNKYVGGVAGNNQGSIDYVLSTVAIRPLNYVEEEKAKYPIDAEYIGKLVGYKSKQGRLRNNITSETMKDIYDNTEIYIPSFHLYLGQNNKQVQLAQERYKYLFDIQENCNCSGSEVDFIRNYLNIDSQNLTINGASVNVEDINNEIIAENERQEKLRDPKLNTNSLKDRNNIIYMKMDTDADARYGFLIKKLKTYQGEIVNTYDKPTFIDEESTLAGLVTIYDYIINSFSPYIWDYEEIDGL